MLLVCETGFYWRKEKLNNLNYEWNYRGKKTYDTKFETN